MLQRHAAKVQRKLDLLTMQSMQSVPLRDGSYAGKALGYSENKEMEVTVSIRGGKISDVQVKHEEKIDLGATRIIPQRIVAQQSLQIDGVTGATVTSQAIVDGALQALKQAGLK
jgi:fumarate reductase flavoprotein subunit